MFKLFLKLRLILASAVLGIVLSGCATPTPSFLEGVNASELPSKFPLGTITYKQVIETYGKPTLDKVETHDSKMYRTVMFFDLQSRKGLLFSFTNLDLSGSLDKALDVILIAPGDNNLSVTVPNVQKIEKSKTTKNEIIALFGQPIGFSAVGSYRLKEGEVSGVIYKADKKLLSVFFNPQDIVTRFDYSEK